MHTRWSFKIAVLALAVLTSSTARAGPQVRLYDSFGTVSGGEFRTEYTQFPFEPKSLGESPTRFETFCLERTEYISFNTWYNVGFSDSSQGNHAPDPLDDQAAWLYSKFITHGLSGYEYSTTDKGDGNPNLLDRIETANALQNALWVFEGELTLANRYYRLNSQYEKDWVDAFYAAANSAVSGGWDNNGQVMVMNLTTLGGAAAQDQLVMSTSVVPSPASTALGVLGLSLASLLRKQRM